MLAAHRAAGRRGALAPYEQLLLDGVFSTGDHTALSALKNHFAARWMPLSG